MGRLLGYRCLVKLPTNMTLTPIVIIPLQHTRGQFWPPYWPGTWPHYWPGTWPRSWPLHWPRVSHDLTFRQRRILRTLRDGAKRSLGLSDRSGRSAGAYWRLSSRHASMEWTNSHNYAPAIGSQLGCKPLMATPEQWFRNSINSTWIAQRATRLRISHCCSWSYWISLSKDSFAKASFR